jgi:hypothetical protein
MNAINFEQQLNSWKKALLFLTGATLTLLATSIAEFPEDGGMILPGWFAVWLIIQLTVTPPGIGLLFSSYWRSVPRIERIGPAIGFLSLAWIAALSFAIRSIGALSAVGFSTSDLLPVLVIGGFFLFATAAAITAAYYVLSRPLKLRSDNLFP